VGIRKTTRTWAYYQQRSRTTRSPQFETGQPAYVSELIEAEWQASYFCARFLLPFARQG